MEIYQLKVSLFDYHEQPINKLHRIIEISEDSTFEDLHNIIFEAFDRFDPHLYSFYLTKNDSKDVHTIMDAPTITNPHSLDNKGLFDDIKPKNAVTTQIKQAKLKEKDVFHYWFDFGDDWWHRIRVQKIITDSSITAPFAKITKKVGISPAQYYNHVPDIDELDIDEFDIEDDDLNFLGLNEEAFKDMDIDQDTLNSIGLDQHDFINIMNAMQSDNMESIVKVLNTNGIANSLKMLELIGNPDDHETRFLLKNIPVMHFLESMDDPDLTLQQERDLLAELINTLQTRLEDVETDIAQNAMPTPSSSIASSIPKKAYSSKKPSSTKKPASAKKTLKSK